MGDAAKFSEKWDFRRKKNSFDDSSSDDPDSNPNHDPIIHNPNLVHHSNQIDNGTKAVTEEQPVKTRKRRIKKDETKPEKPKQVRGRKPKPVCVEENTKKEETIMDGVGTFMETLVDDLAASRESLMDWMKTELYGSSNQNVPSRPPLKKREAGTVAAQKPAKRRRRTKKMIEEEEKTKKNKDEEEKKETVKQSKPDKTGQEMNTTKEKRLEITQIDGDLDRNAGTLEKSLKSGQSGSGRNYFQQQQQDQEAIVAQTEMENLKNETVTSQKSIVLAIQAPNLSKKQKKASDANTYKNTSSMVESIGPETQKDHYAVTPYVPQPSSSLQSYPVPSSYYPNLSSSSLLPSYPVPSSLFSSSSQGINSLAGNTNFQMRQPVAQIPELSEFQTGVTGRQEFGNPLFDSIGYLSGFPPAFQPNLIAGGYNFPAQVNPATSSQQRDNNNKLGGLTMAGGAIRYSGNRYPEAEHRNGYNGLSDYRTSSGR